MARVTIHPKPKAACNVYLAFYKPSFRALIKHPFDLAICLFTWSRLSHVEIVIAYDHQTWGLRRWYSSSPRDGGMRIRQIAPRPEHWVFVHIPWVSQEQAEELHDWFDRKRGRRYDWPGALTCLLGGFLNYKRRWFCSEAVVDSLQDSDVLPSLARPSKRISPARLFSLLTIWCNTKGGCTTRTMNVDEVGA